MSENMTSGGSITTYALPEAYRLAPRNTQHFIPTVSRGSESPLATPAEAKDRRRRNMKDTESDLPVQALPPPPVAQPMSNPFEPAKPSHKRRPKKVKEEIVGSETPKLLSVARLVTKLPLVTRTIRKLARRNLWAQMVPPSQYNLRRRALRSQVNSNGYGKITSSSVSLREAYSCSFRPSPAPFMTQPTSHSPESCRERNPSAKGH
jgi:hypothetical protein